MFNHRLALSSWSLHRLLGPLRWTVWDENSRDQITREQPQPQEMTLLELPKIASAKGFRYLELCHFHFPSTEEEYLMQLRQAFKDADIHFHTLLVDYGDISSPDEGRRQSDIQFLRRWLEIASIAGAAAVRVIAGEQPAGDTESLKRSCEAFVSLSTYGNMLGVKVVTENFRELTATVQSWQQLMEGIEPPIGTIVDFGNLSLAERATGIAYGAPLAHSIHAKPLYHEDGSLDKEDFERMLSIVAAHNDRVPITVIFDQDGDMWEGITTIQAFIQSVTKEGRG